MGYNYLSFCLLCRFDHYICPLRRNERTVHLVPLVGGGLNALGNAIGYRDTLLAKADTLIVQKQTPKANRIAFGVVVKVYFSR